MRPVGRGAPAAFRDIPLHLGAGLRLVGIAPGMQEALALGALRFPDRTPLQVFEEGGPQLVRNGESHAVNLGVDKPESSPLANLLQTSLLTPYDRGPRLGYAQTPQTLPTDLPRTGLFQAVQECLPALKVP